MTRTLSTVPHFSNDLKRYDVSELLICLQISCNAFSLNSAEYKPGLYKSVPGFSPVVTDVGSNAPCEFNEFIVDPFDIGRWIVIE